MSEFAKDNRDAAFLLGSGVALFVGWFSAAIVGHIVGEVLQNPKQLGLDFTFTAVFVVLLVGMWQGKSSLLPWIAAALVAMVTARWLPGKWYIVFGGLAGSLVGALRDAR